MLRRFSIPHHIGELPPSDRYSDWSAALQGQGLDAQGKLATTGASYTYTPSATYTGLGAAQTGDGGNAGNGAVEGIAYAVRCKATKARGRQEPRYTIETQPSPSQPDGTRVAFVCPSDVADTFTTAGAGPGGGPQ